ncbi:MAG: hypothetical protein JXB10_03025 [Pirellulales bacterium]|nr:hypothetical protein [Pirellulales bacterium]
MQFAIYNLFTLAAAEETKKVVIPFDFVSKWDDGRYGGMVGEMIWKKLEREGGFLLPETMQDVRDVCGRLHFRPTPETPLTKMKKIVTKDFDAQIGIWGSVERVGGTDGEIYDLAIKCVDFSAKEPKVIYQVQARTKSVSEIPHLYVKQMLDALYERQPLGPPPADKLVEENWKKNTNLITGGDFQSGTGGVPKGWEKVAGQQREPLGKLVQWTADPEKPKNRVIRFTFPKIVGDNEGVMYYSEFFPIEEGAKYRFQCRYRTDGPNVKVFIKCYDAERSPYQNDSLSLRERAGVRAEAGKKAARSKFFDKNGPHPNPLPKGEGTHRNGVRRESEYVPEESQRREVYRAQMNLKGLKDQWNTHTQDFTPKHTKYTPRWGRVMLYAYLGAGTVEFDDVVVKQIVPPSPGVRQKRPRPSSASEVTIEEMRENDRRGGKE